jgi:hypothetical protein
MKVLQLPGNRGTHWIEDENEFMVSSRMPQIGDVISLLGTPHDLRYLILDEFVLIPRLPEVTGYYKPPENAPLRYKTKSLNLKTNAIEELVLFSHYTYRLINTLVDL